MTKLPRLYKQTKTGSGVPLKPIGLGIRNCHPNGEPIE